MHVTAHASWGVEAETSAIHISLALLGLILYLAISVAPRSLALAGRLVVAEVFASGVPALLV